MTWVLGTRCVICGDEAALRPETTVCGRCSGNLDIVYDYAALRPIITRDRLESSPDRSIFRYAPLLPLGEATPRLPLEIGSTPLMRARRLGELIGLPRLLLKDEGRNPSGSLKDRASAVVLLGALEEGRRAVVGASTGNAGSSMACLAASVGLDCVILVPATAPPAKLAQLLSFGAKVLPVRGTYDQAFDLSLELAARFGWCSRSTGYNPRTREGKKTCALEIWEQLGYTLPDWVFVSVGDGNILSGLHKGFCDLQRLGLTSRVPRLCAVQSSASNAIARAVAAHAASRPTPPSEITIAPVHATTRADSIGVDLPRDGVAAVRAVQESEGAAMEVDDAEILSAIPLVAAASGVFGEPAAVASVAGLRRALARGLVATHETVVCVITGSGLKDVAAALEVSALPPAIEPTIEALIAAWG
jgi:threonine synthase